MHRPFSLAIRSELQSLIFIHSIQLSNVDLGTFLRVSEVRSNFRTAVTIPEKFWPKFRDILGEIIGEYQDNKKVGEEKRAVAGGGGATAATTEVAAGAAAGVVGGAESDVSSVVGAAERGLSDVSDQDDDEDDT